MRPKHLLLLLAALLLPVLAVGGWSLYQDDDVAKRSAKVEDLILAGDLGQAMNQAQVLQRKYPNRPEGWLLAGSIYHDRWMPDAGDMYMRAYATHPEGFPELPQLALALGMSGETKLEVKDLLDAHARSWPDDDGLLEAQMLAVSDFLVLRVNNEKQAARMEKELEQLTTRLQVRPHSTSSSYYHESEALILLHRWDEAAEAMENGIAANTEIWERLIMQMGLAFLRLHQGREAEARRMIEEYVELYTAWPGYHFAMRMPMIEFLQITTRVRFSEDLAVPERVHTRRDEAQKAGVMVQFGTEETRQLLEDLITADLAGDLDAVVQIAGDLLVMLVRDRGCVTETAIVRPHVISMVLVLRSRTLLQLGQTEAALADMVRAAAFYPEDTWLQQQLADLNADPRLAAEPAGG